MVFGKIRISTILILLLLLTLFFATRLINIMSLPIFTDEAIYVRWSQIARQDAAWRFISLTDGKQPLFIWGAMNMMRIVKDPLLAARLVSVFAGLGTLIGVMVLSLELFKKKREGSTLNQLFGHLADSKRIGIIAGFLFILFPFALVLDRMALYDSLVALTLVWCLYFEVLLARYIRLDIALLLGAAIGGAVLTKTSGFFAIYLLPFSLLLFDFKKKDATRKFLEWVLFAIASSVIAYLIYSILRLSPFFYIIDEKNALFVYPFSEWLKHPFTYLYGNFNALIPWIVTYVTLPILVLVVLSFFVKRNRNEKLLLLVWFILPYVGLGLFGKTLYPRFIYFMTIPFIILAAFSIEHLFKRLKNKTYSIILFLISISLFVYASFLIVFDFPHAPIPQADLGQYINSWPAGGGIKEMVEFFNQEAKKGKIFVATKGAFDSLQTNSVDIYLGDNKNIEKKGIYPLPELIPAELKQKAKVMPVYFVFNDSENAPSNWPLILIAKYQKGIGDRHLSIYELLQL